MTMFIPAIKEFLVHTASQVERVNGMDASSEPTYGPPDPNIRCFFQSYNRTIIQSNGDVKRTRGLFFFDKDYDPGELAIITFRGNKYIILQVEVIYDDSEEVHHYEAICV